MIALASVVLAPSAALAADSAYEIGTSLAGLTIGLGDNKESILGIPTSGFGVNPDLYASFFVGKQLAIEPRIGLIYESSNGHSNHLAHVAAQADYFVKSNREESPYLFAGVGVLAVSGVSSTPKSVSGGAGYRLLVGSRLVFRFEGRLTHLSDGGGNALAFGVSIGGTFGQRK